MFREALSYPTRNPDGPRSVLVGGGLVFLTALFGLTTLLEGSVSLLAILALLPWLALRGYYVRVVRTTIGRDRPTPPALEDGRRLIRDGLASAFVSAVYLLPGVVVIGPLVYARAAGTDAGTLYAEIGLPTALANAAVSVTGLLAIFAAMYLLGAIYTIPVAVARYAHEDRLRAAFQVRRVVGGALTEDYAVAWAITLLMHPLFLVAYALRVAVVGFFLHFVVAVGIRYCYGQGVGAGMDLDPVVPDRTETDRSRDTPGDRRTPRPADPGEDPMDAARERSAGTGSTAAGDPANASGAGDGDPGVSTTGEDVAGTGGVSSGTGEEAATAEDEADPDDPGADTADGEGERT